MKTVCSENFPQVGKNKIWFQFTVGKYFRPEDGGKKIRITVSIMVFFPT